jgi:hypothetical protein
MHSDRKDATMYRQRLTQQTYARKKSLISNCEIKSSMADRKLE